MALGYDRSGFVTVIGIVLGRPPSPLASVLILLLESGDNNTVLMGLLQELNGTVYTKPESNKITQGGDIVRSITIHGRTDSFSLFKRGM